MRMWHGVYHIRTLRFKTVLYFLIVCAILLLSVYITVFVVAKNRKIKKVTYDFLKYVVSPVNNVTDIKSRIMSINLEEKIYNQEQFGPVKNDSLVIVVQVHDRLLHLKYLIDSFVVARDIDSVLLIFSHDVFDEGINSLIHSINFCKVMQLFYPYSTQIYPDEFPGNDSSSNISIKNVSAKPYIDDKEFHRNATLTQIKHHWWWKAHKVFSLAALRKHNGLILFLEEDLYVMEDFIPVLRLMLKTSEKFCSICKALSLSGNSPNISLDYFDNFMTVEIKKRFSNIGLAFNRSTWAEMVKCRLSFCLRNEYNWDFSLLNVFTMCMRDSAAMILLNPRVFHLGICGIHFKSDNCDPAEVVLKLRELFTNNTHYMFPTAPSIIENFNDNPCSTEFGGWADPRDHELCLNISHQYGYS